MLQSSRCKRAMPGRGVVWYQPALFEHCAAREGHCEARASQAAFSFPRSRSIELPAYRCGKKDSHKQRKDGIAGVKLCHNGDRRKYRGKQGHYGHITPLHSTPYMTVQSSNQHLMVFSWSHIGKRKYKYVPCIKGPNLLFLCFSFSISKDNIPILNSQ